MLSNQEKIKNGLQFEKNIHELLKNKNDYNLYSGQKTVKLVKDKGHGSICHGFDHVLINDKNIICIQDKWSNLKSSYSVMTNFCSSIGIISHIFPNVQILGIFISKVEITKDAHDLLVFAKKNHPNILKIKLISGNDQTVIFEELDDLLHDNGVYSYYCDGSCIMSNN